jgi:hypothetical protein
MHAHNKNAELTKDLEQKMSVEAAAKLAVEQGETYRWCFLMCQQPLCAQVVADWTGIPIGSQ